MTRVIVATKKHNSEHLIGQFLDESNYDILIEEDTDFYMTPACDVQTVIDCSNKNRCSSCEKGADEKRIGFKFRKNFFSQEEQEQAYKGLREAATVSDNRGIAAGPRTQESGGFREWVTSEQRDILKALMKDKDALVEFDVIEHIKQEYKNGRRKESPEGIVWKSTKTKEHNFNYEEWIKSLKGMSAAERSSSAKYVWDTFVSNTSYANPAHSGIAGWFDRFPRFPYGRDTLYTANNFEKFQMSYPFLQSLARGFKELMPWRYGNQMRESEKIDPKFLVPGTPFTTLTVNKTFRTAAHLDAGDLSEGLSNLLVLSNDGNYTGGYLVFPEYRTAVNVRPGDLLLVNNHEIIHGNTPIVLGSESSERISVVCYFREGMKELGEYKYEKYREKFIKGRIENTNHPYWKTGWNGVTPGCMGDKPTEGKNAEEWYEFLLSQEEGERYMKMYHPWYFDSKSKISLEEFF